MRRHQMMLGALLTFAATAAMSATPSYAMSMKDCSAKYAATKANGSSAAKSWIDFRRSECSSAATPTPAALVAPQTAAASAKTTAAAPYKPAPKLPQNQSASAANAVFPSVIAAAYAQKSVGKARMQTCLDQYDANKATNANGGLKWIEKGGGYYSICNKRLKGNA